MVAKNKKKRANEKNVNKSNQSKGTRIKRVSREVQDKNNKNRTSEQLSRIIKELFYKKNELKTKIEKMFAEDLDLSQYLEWQKRLSNLSDELEKLAKQESGLDKLKTHGKMLIELFEKELELKAKEPVIVPFEYLDEKNQRIRGDIRIERDIYVNANANIMTLLFDSRKHTVHVSQKKLVELLLAGKIEGPIIVDNKEYLVNIEKAIVYLRLAKAINALKREIELLQKENADELELNELKSIQVSFLHDITDLARHFVHKMQENKAKAYYESYLYKLTRANMLNDAVNLCLGATVHFTYEGKNMVGKLVGLLNNKLIVEVEDNKGYWLLNPKRLFHVEIDNIVYVRPADIVQQIELKERVNELSNQILDSKSDPNKVLRNALSLLKFVENNPKLLSRILSSAKDYRMNNSRDSKEKEEAKKLDLRYFNQLTEEEKVLVVRDGIMNL
ncbi:MAG: hypothetical protein N3E37_03920 [Candidatus Micrarchaeota archaeon]|nr:hypothetical protein [Candidatus Micrarchaeota archaeon]